MSILVLLSGCLLTKELHFLSAQKKVVYDLASPPPIEIPFASQGDSVVLFDADMGVPMKLVFDTGAPVTAVFDTPTEGLDLDLSHARKLGDPDDPEVPFGSFLYDYRLRLGDLTLERLPIVGIPLDSIPCPDKIRELGLNGAIGRDLLRRFAVELDFDHDVARLYDATTYTPPAGAAIVPVTMKSGHWFVHARVDLPDGPREGMLHVDSGSTSGIDIILRDGEAPPAGTTTRQACSVQGLRPVYDGGTVDVAIGSATATQVEVSWVEDNAMVPDQIGRIGIRGLRKLIPVFDETNERLVLVSRGSHP
jgi:hypothetical protein